MKRRDFLKLTTFSTLFLSFPKLLQASTASLQHQRQIFEPVTLKNLTLKNRLIRSATWEGIATPEGNLAPKAYEIYDELARGGIGGIITSYTSVCPYDTQLDKMMRLTDDSLIPEYKKLTDTIHSHNCPAIVQLALGSYHRKNKTNSIEQIDINDMTEEDIKNVVDMFKNASIRAQKANFDGIQIHSAHFFFLSRFISPATNQRKDNYGGSTENRARILTEIIAEIKKVAPKLHLTIKINSNDFKPNGLDETESLKICKILAKSGLDSIEVSGNGTTKQGIKPHINEGYFVDFASKLANEVDIPIFVVGGIRSKEKMEEILKTTKITGISLSRPLLCEPDFPNKLKNNQTSTSKCTSCNACFTTPYHQCIFRIHS